MELKIVDMKNLQKIILIIFTLSITNVFADKLLIPMDLSQTDHLKAYGITFWNLQNGNKAEWLLNYRGGSFMMEYDSEVATECRIRGVQFERISGAAAANLYAEIKDEGTNQDVVKLEVPPKIAVYAPPGAQPWDDAVRLVLEYAEIEHELLWDEEVLDGKLKEYDWLHLHHEDFTGQHGKFWHNFRNQPWYIQMVELNESMAKKLGYSDVCTMKKDVVKEIKKYIADGGFMFSMCSGADSFDIALAAEDIDICHEMFDGNSVSPNINSKLNFDKTLAFENFEIISDPTIYEHSTIDVGPTSLSNPDADFFTLFEFSAKYDPVPTMLTQSHINVIKGFLGQNTGFKRETIKKSVTILAERDGTDEVKYIHSNFGRGTFTLYGGHDPEDYRHAVGDPPTDLNLFKNSPGYRLILNNILFPAAKKKKQKT